MVSNQRQLRSRWWRQAFITAIVGVSLVFSVIRNFCFRHFMFNWFCRREMWIEYKFSVFFLKILSRFHRRQDLLSQFIQTFWCLRDLLNKLTGCLISLVVVGCDRLYFYDLYLLCGLRIDWLRVRGALLIDLWLLITHQLNQLLFNLNLTRSTINDTLLTLWRYLTFLIMRIILLCYNSCSFFKVILFVAMVNSLPPLPKLHRLWKLHPKFHSG